MSTVRPPVEMTDDELHAAWHAHLDEPARLVAEASPVYTAWFAAWLHRHHELRDELRARRSLGK